MDLAQMIAGIGQQTPASNASGWEGVGQGLGGILGGGGARGQEAYYDGMDSGLGIVKKTLEARKLRDEAMARQRLYRRLVDMGVDPAKAGVLESVSLGGMGSDFRGATQGLGELQDQDLQQQAAAAADPMVRNQVLSALHGQPQDLTKVSGGVGYNPTVEPTAQEMVLTPAAAADDVRQSMVANSQVRRNTQTGDAAMIRATRPPAARAGARSGRDPVRDHADKKAVDAIYSEFAPRLADASLPGDRADILAERDKRVAEVLGTRAQDVSQMDVQNARARAAAMADAIEVDDGYRLDESQKADLERQIREGLPIQIMAPGAPGVGYDGTNPPQVIDPDTSRPVGDTRAAPRSNDGLPPMLDYERGGTVGSATTAAPGGPPRLGTRGSPAQPKTDADYNALPKGAYFIDPDDGRTYRKD